MTTKKLLLTLLLTSTLYAGSDNMTSVTAFRHEEVKALRHILDQWAIDAYREYPYLYVYQEETDYNTLFEVDPDAIVLFAERDGQKLGMISASPLHSPYLQEQAYTPSAYLDEIKAQGFNPETIYYISCFLMQKEERQNREAALLLFDKAVAFAKSLGKTQIAYMEISQTPNHPLKPDSYLPCEPWALLNRPFRPMGVAVCTSWPTLQADGSVCDQTHTLPLYVMDI